jgi:glycosyltransferase involved in cell wall biosynthesis
MKIAFVSHWGGRGGAEKALAEIIDATRSLGHEAVCFVPVRGWLQQYLELSGVRVIIHPVPWWASNNAPLLVRAKHILTHPFAVAWLAMRLRGFDVVYSNSVVIAVAALAAWLARVPHVWHLHEALGDKDGHQFYLGTNPSVALIRELSSVVVGASRTVLEGAKQVGTVMYLPPSTRPQSVERKPYTVVVVGHMSKAKRMEDAIEAVRLLVANGVRVSLRIVGDGDERRELERRALCLPVEFTGSLPDAAPEIAGAAALLNCSPVEGFGRVTVEAMALGTPVIAADAGANRELIRDGETGLLYQPGNVRQLAKDIKLLLEDRTLANDIASRARKHVESIASAEAMRQTIATVLAKAVAA